MLEPSQPLARRPARWIAVGLFIGTFGLLFATQDMGFTRDESFYFGYSETYQDWFARAAEAEKPEAISSGASAERSSRAISSGASAERSSRAIFGRDETLRTWNGNFEHPPLMKSLFGFSWRLFARKDRAVIGVKAAPAGQGLRFEIFSNPAEGFALGAEVDLLAPLAQGQDPTDPARVLAHGVVTKRTADRAEVTATPVAADAADPDGEGAAPALGIRDLTERCRAVANAATPPAEIPVTRCQAREDRTLAFLSESQAMRLPGILSGALAVALTFLLGLELFGWLAGLFGALAFIFVPEHFFHAHLTCFDMPIVAAQVFVLFAFWRSLRDRRWALAAGVGWGVALLTKHNAFFLPFGLVVWWLAAGRDRFRVLVRDPLPATSDVSSLASSDALSPTPAAAPPPKRRWRLSVQLPPLPLALLVMPVVALPIFFSYWPRLWYDPFRAVRDYFGFHLQHDHYMQYWFGEPLQVPPFRASYVFEKTGLMYPEILIFLFIVGLFFLAPPTRWRAWLGGLFRGSPVSQHERVATFAVLNALLPLLIIAMPGTPIFGGIKHWMTGAPFIGIIAGYGLTRVVGSLRFPAPVALATAVLLLAHPVAASLRNAWIGTGYYNALFAGGLQGAADKRLMRLFWGYTTRQTLDWLNAHAPHNARVFWQNTPWGSYDMYQREGWLREDIRYADGPDHAQIALIDPKQAFMELDFATRRALGVTGPDWIVSEEGVPFMMVFVRPGALEPPKPAAAPKPVAPKPH